MSRILITGGAGYIGGYASSYLQSKNHDVTVYDSLLYESRYLKNIDFIYGDIRDREKLSKILPKYDTVIWLSALVGDGACSVDPFLCQSINELTIQWLANNYDGKIIFTSTASVYGANHDLITEDSPVNPLSVYAVTKLHAEKHLINRKNTLIFRLGTLFGLGDEFSRIRFDLVVNVLTKKATLGEQLTVFGGEQWRPLLHVKDVAEAIEVGINKDISGLYNLHYDNFTIKNIAEQIKTIIPNVDVKYQEMSFEDSRNYKVASDKFRQLGWMPKYSITDGIRELNNVIKEGRIKNVNDPIYSNQSIMSSIKTSDWVKT